jgi:hypothetical protein
MSHTSVNFDRTGFQEDVNVVFPLDRLRELHKEGVVGAIARRHYSFMGASPIQALEPKARELAGLMRGEGVVPPPDQPDPRACRGHPAPGGPCGSPSCSAGRSAPLTRPTFKAG